jgi:hypothetical protein
VYLSRDYNLGSVELDYAVHRAFFRFDKSGVVAWKLC